MLRIVLTLSLLSLVGVCTAASTARTDKELIVVAGAGPSTAVAKAFFQAFAKLPAADGYSFGVPARSIKHAGGIKWSDEHLFGRIGRPLNLREKALNKGEILLAGIPAAFAVGSEVGVTSMTLEQLEGIYTGSITNWQALGGNDHDIELLGREPTEVMFTVLKEKYPFFQGVGELFSKVLKKDHHVVNLLRSAQGRYAIGFGARPSFTDVDVVAVEGLTAGVNVGLVYDLANEEHPLVKAAMEYARSDDWAGRSTATGQVGRPN